MVLHPAEQPPCALQVTEAGLITVGITTMAFLARQMQVSGSYFGGNATSVPIAIPSQDASALAQLSVINAVTENQRSLYLDIGQSSC